MMSSTLAGQPLTVAITYPFALGTRSGGSTSVFETSRGLARLGVDVVLLPVSTAKWTSFPRRPVTGNLLGEERRLELESEGVEVVPVTPHPVSPWLEGRRVARSLRSLAERRRVDVVLGFHHEASNLARLAERLDTRFCMIAIWQSYRIALEQDPQRHGLLAPLVRRLNQRVVVDPLRRAEIVFATSEFTRSELVECVGVDPERVEVCYQGIDPVFATLPRVAPARVERILFFGRLVREKGLFDALRALAGVAAGERRCWTYRIMGDGDAQAVRRFAAEQGIADRVEILPFQGTEALCRELEAAHVALMPSFSESFGLSIAEAQLAGIPVVAYDCGSVPEIVEHGVTGWLAPFGNVDRLSRYVETALDDAAATAAAGLAGRRRLDRRFTWERTTERILQRLRRG